QSRNKTDPCQYPCMAHGPVGRQTGGDVATGDCEKCAIGCGQREEWIGHQTWRAREYASGVHHRVPSGRAERRHNEAGAHSAGAGEPRLQERTPLPCAASKASSLRIWLPCPARARSVQMSSCMASKVMVSVTPSAVAF